MSDDIVETTCGRVRGANIAGAKVFKGLRYGASTEGRNRFKAPEPPKPWPGVAEALNFGASAMQAATAQSLDPFTSWYFAIEPMSEDCLFLNVFTPATDAAKRPVMVWLHGGAWSWCSGTAPGFDGTALAQAEDVVVVTLNHRLDIFGYLYLGEDDGRFRDSGNAGILDIVQALAWVRDNIGMFGGDPGNVTLFGESGGGSKVAAMLALPAASGLFHKAIIQSTGGGMQLAEAGEAIHHTACMLSRFGVGWHELDRLQSIPVDTLVDAITRRPRPFRAVRDGYHFPRHPFAPGATAATRNIPLLVGSTTTEATFYLRHNPANWSIEWQDAERRISRFLKIGPEEARSVLCCYRRANPSFTVPELFAAVGSDFMFKRNAYAIAAMQSDASEQPVFSYLFDWRTPIDGGRYGSPHTCDVPFIFGTTQRAHGLVGRNDDDASMSATMMAAWGAFARCGSPRNPRLPDWTPYTPDNRGVMVLNRESRVQADPGSDARAALDGLPYFGYGHSIPAYVHD